MPENTVFIYVFAMALSIFSNIISKIVIIFFWYLKGIYYG